MLSFIVPAYNEEFELPSTLAAIKNAVGSDRPYEILVVDDASTDATVRIAEQSGAKVVSINRRQIAAARNTGAQAAHGDILFFVDADTRINVKHVDGAITALQNGDVGGSARVEVHGPIPFWAKMFLRVFCTLYFAVNLGAGAFLFTTRRNFQAVGGFDEKLFVGEEVYFSLALRRIGRFKILREPIITSGRKLRMYSAREIFGNMFAIMLGGKRAAGSRDKLDIWYNGKRESPSRTGGPSSPPDESVRLADRSGVIST
jgi:glycosyltransferase involved in cell wall biosynthesis